MPQFLGANTAHPPAPKKVPRREELGKKAATRRAAQDNTTQRPFLPTITPQERDSDAARAPLPFRPSGHKTPPQTYHAAPRVKDSDAAADRHAGDLESATVGLPGTINALPCPSLLQLE